MHKATELLDSIHGADDEAEKNYLLVEAFKEVIQAERARADERVASVLKPISYKREVINRMIALEGHVGISGQIYIGVAKVLSSLEDEIRAQLAVLGREKG